MFFTASLCPLSPPRKHSFISFTRALEQVVKAAALASNIVQLSSSTQRAGSDCWPFFPTQLHAATFAAFRSLYRFSVQSPGGLICSSSCSSPHAVANGTRIPPKKAQATRLRPIPRTKPIVLMVNPPLVCVDCAYARMLMLEAGAGRVVQVAASASRRSTPPAALRAPR